MGDEIYVKAEQTIKGVKTYLKFSRIEMYAFLKLWQFLGRGIKEHFLTAGYVNNFKKFVRATNGEFNMYRIPYRENLDLNTARENICGRLNTAGIHYCIHDCINERDKFIHVSVKKSDADRFSSVFNWYVTDSLAGKNLSGKDLINFTNEKTSIISVPAAAAEKMEQALGKLDVNMVRLPDLMDNLKEKQYRISNADINTVQQVYKMYNDSIINGKDIQKPAENKEETIKNDRLLIIDEQKYTEAFKETTEDWINSAAPEIKEITAQYDVIEPDEQERGFIEAAGSIKDSDSLECAALKQNPDCIMLSIDKKTLVDTNNLNAELISRGQNDHIACFIPGTQKKETLILNKKQVFEVKGETSVRYLAFLNKKDRPEVFLKNLDSRCGTYPSAVALFSKFDNHNKKKSAERKSPAAAKNRFNNFQQRDIDIDALEKLLVENR